MAIPHSVFTQQGPLFLVFYPKDNFISQGFTCPLYYYHPLTVAVQFYNQAWPCARLEVKKGKEKRTLPSPRKMGLEFLLCMPAVQFLVRYSMSTKLGDKGRKKPEKTHYHICCPMCLLLFTFLESSRSCFLYFALSFQFQSVGEIDVQQCSMLDALVRNPTSNP